MFCIYCKKESINKYCSKRCSRKHVLDLSKEFDILDKKCDSNNIMHYDQLIEYTNVNSVRKAKNNKSFYNSMIYWFNENNIECNTMTFVEGYYFFKNRLKEIPICPICKINKLKHYRRGRYLKTCSFKCSANNINRRIKCENTCLEKYGVSNVLKSKTICDKIKKTCLDKYGVDNVFKSEYFNSIRKPLTEGSINRIIKTRRATTYKSFERFNNIVLPNFTIDEFNGIGYDKSYSWKCVKCNNIFDTYYYTQTPRCPTCFPRKRSYIEDKIYNFLTSNNINFKKNDRTLLYPLEVDFLIKDHNIGIELDGLYWHNDVNLEDNNYHLYKTEKCKELGISLIHIFEDELNYKPQIVFNRLKYRLKLLKYNIGGRKCEIREISSELKNKFLDKYHIQGRDASNIKLGLFYKNRLVAVMTFCGQRLALGSKNIKGNLELSRFCTIGSFNVIGAASKLLKYFENTYFPKMIITYADRRWSTGELYKQLGFTFDHVSKPNYWYVDKRYDQRIHRFNFRKNVLKDKLVKFDENLSEYANMKNNGYTKVWDCGNYVFIKKY